MEMVQLGQQSVDVFSNIQMPLVDLCPQDVCQSAQNGMSVSRAGLNVHFRSFRLGNKVLGSTDEIEFRGETHDEHFKEVWLDAELLKKCKDSPVFETFGVCRTWGCTIRERCEQKWECGLCHMSGGDCGDFGEEFQDSLSDEICKVSV